MISIERATTLTPELVEAIEKLLPQLVGEPLEVVKEHINEILSNPTVFLMLAYENGHIIGTITTIVYRTPSGKRAYMEDLVVDAFHRGKGLGELLVKKGIEIAKEHSAEYIDLTSRSSRKEANSLYQRLGFEKRETNAYRYYLKHATQPQQ